MSDYTPTENEVAEAYNRDGASVAVRFGVLVNEAVEKSEAEVRRALSKVKADAWDEAINFISRHYEDYLPVGWQSKADEGNPHRGVERGLFE